jgi:HSP20 family molecular chaperone IbpA
MSRMTVLDGNLWLSLSAERLGAPAKAAEGNYPPYNIELLPADETGSEILRITLAVAGFAREELDVSVEDGALTICGAKRDEGPKDYLHRGIAARQFNRTFALAKGVEVRKAELHDGLLAIELERPPREKRVLKLGIAPAG